MRLTTTLMTMATNADNENVDKAAEITLRKTGNAGFFSSPHCTTLHSSLSTRAEASI